MIEAHADLNVSDYDRRSLGHLAAAEGHWELLKVLLKTEIFDFEGKDRWQNSTVDQIKQHADCEGKTQILAMYEEMKQKN